MTIPAGSNLRGAAYALAGFAFFATHDAVVKQLGGSYTTFQILFFSVLFSFPLVMMMLMRDTTRDTLIPRHPWWTALRTVATLITGVCVFFAFSQLPLAEVYAIIFMMPILITVMSIPILGERVGVHRWAAIVVGLIGVVIVLRPGNAPLSLGHAAAMTGAVFGALVSIIVRKIGQEERNAVLMLYPMMANFVVMAGALPWVYVPMPIEDIGLVALMSALAFVAGLCIIRAYRLADAAIVAPMQYSQIVWAALFGIMFFGEAADLLTWVGAGVIISSGLYIVVRESLGGLSKNTPVLDNRSRAETGTTPRVSSMQGVLGRTPLRRTH